MELRRLNYRQITDIYHTYMVADFPEDELRPLTEFSERLGRGIYECLGLYEGMQLMAYGFFAINREREYVLLDFFAVCPSYRNSGYGSRFLELVRGYYAAMKGVLVECESPENAPDEAQRMIRQKRISFYQRNDCRMTGVKSLLFGVAFDIWYLPIQERQPQADVELRMMYQLMFPEKRWESCAQIWNA